VAAIRCHSASTFSRPLSKKRRRPLASLIWPFTGSTIAYSYGEVAGSPLRLVAISSTPAGSCWRRAGEQDFPGLLSWGVFRDATDAGHGRDSRKWLSKECCALG